VDSPHTAEITELLRCFDDGDSASGERLLSLVYGELRRLARGQLDRGPGQSTLQPTALVHEAYLRLVEKDSASWQGRQHFYAVAARAMRSVLIDHARARAAAKRGGDLQRVPLERVLVEVEERAMDLLALDEALERLADMDGELARLVELRFFAGMSLAETADVLGVSTRTVERSWRTARAWLHEALTEPGEHD
jgi:RNA polymerase sigma factor (TIGR02999 family)